MIGHRLRNKTFRNTGRMNDECWWFFKIVYRYHDIIVITPKQESVSLFLWWKIYTKATEANLHEQLTSMTFMSNWLKLDHNKILLVGVPSIDLWNLTLFHRFMQKATKAVKNRHVTITGVNIRKCAGKLQIMLRSDQIQNVPVRKIRFLWIASDSCIFYTHSIIWRRREEQHSINCG